MKWQPMDLVAALGQATRSQLVQLGQAARLFARLVVLSGSTLRRYQRLLGCRLRYSNQRQTDN